MRVVTFARDHGYKENKTGEGMSEKPDEANNNKENEELDMEGETSDLRGDLEEEAADVMSDLEKARSEAGEYLENLQRLQAEFENFRKRMIREQSEYLSMASEDLIVKLLPVMDNFERALNHREDAVSDDYHAGIELLYNQVRDVLNKEGLRVIDPLGKEFDPKKHEAMMQVESDEHDENVVVEVLDNGYELKGKVIRPAKVKVAR